MDIDARLEALAQSLELAVSLHNDLEKKTAERFAKTDRQFAKTDRQLAETDRRLRRAIEASVKEARHERQMRRELESRFDRKTTQFDRKMTQLAAAQLVTEEKLKGLIDSLRRSANGRR